MDISQPEIPSCVAIGQLLVINPQLVKDGGVQVVEMNPVLPRIVSILIGGAILDPRLDPSTGEEHGIGVGIVIPAVAPLGDWRPTKFPTPQHERLIEQAPLLEISDQPGHRLVHLTGQAGMLLAQVAV